MQSRLFQSKSNTSYASARRKFTDVNQVRFTPANSFSETEADRAADDVTAGNRASSSTAPVSTFADTPSQPGLIQEALSSPGIPIEARTLAPMEARFGHSFSKVRIHSDAPAARSAADLNARAYTFGESIVFGQDQYNLRHPEGQRLLAHELAHVVQQRAAGPQAPPHIQCEHYSKTLRARPWYQLNEGKQVKSGSSVGGADMPLEYDDSKDKVFRVTFPCDWVFVHAWPDSKRSDYVSKFMQEVKRVWDNRFLMVETQKPNRTANVNIEFKNYINPQVNSSDSDLGNTALEGRIWDNRPDDGLLHWTMDLRVPKVRAHVSGGVVSLAESSNTAVTMTEAEWASRSTAVRRPRNSSDKTKYTQTTSPHEFGHMLGLTDEYLEDSNVSGGGAGPLDPERVEINDRIMNVGERVTPDAYAPFADWLSFLTGSKWKVGKQLR